MADPTPTDPELLFRPDTFFLKPWRAIGVVRSAAGLTVDRFTGHGVGRTGSRAASAEMTFTYESGTVQTVEMDIFSDADGHYYSRDLRSGLEGRGRYVGGDFRWTYSRVPIPGMKGLAGKLLRAHVTSTFSLLSPSRAMGFTEVRLFGALMRTMTTSFEHLDAPPIDSPQTAPAAQPEPAAAK